MGGRAHILKSRARKGTGQVHTRESRARRRVEVAGKRLSNRHVALVVETETR